VANVFAIEALPSDWANEAIDESAALYSSWVDTAP
jgi:hypothetical protein